MEENQAGGLAGKLEEAFGLATAGRLGDAARAALWALAAEGAIAGETAHALVEIDVQARGRAGKASKGTASAATAHTAQRREETRLAWALAVPWAIRGRIGLPLATLAVFGMLIARAGERRGEWRAELSFTEMQRRLGGASRHTVAGAVKRLERHGFIRAIRRRRNPRFCEVNVYVLEHPQAAQAAAREPWTCDAGLEGAGKIAVDAPASNSAPNSTHKNPKKDSATKIQVPLQSQHNHFPKPTSAKPGTTNHPSCSSLQDDKRRGLAPPRPPQAPLAEFEPLTEATARFLAREAAAELWDRGRGAVPGTEAGEGHGDHWRIAERLLKGELAEFDRRTWKAAHSHHGPRAALAVIETALMARIREGTDDPIRSPAAYLGGILRRAPHDCRPEITLRRLAAARPAGVAR